MKHPLQVELENMPEEVRRTLIRAQGFAEARMPRLARAELAEIPPPHRHTFACLNVALEIAQAEKNWEEARRAAETLANRFPAQAEYRGAWAFAARRSSGLDEARAILTRAVADFPDEVIFVYNLACYAAVAGETPSAVALFLKAYAKDSGVLAMGLEDEDLVSIQDVLIQLESAASGSP